VDKVTLTDISLNSNLQCHAISTKSLSQIDNEQFSICIYGAVYLDNVISSATEVAKIFVTLNKDVINTYARLSGHFWIILLNKVSQRLYLFNDHFGIQPCFYTLQNNVLTVSDSLKCMRNVEGMALNVSEQALFNYMYFHCIPSPNTIFEQVAKLEPGKAVVFDENGFVKKIQLYQPDFNQQAEVDKQQYVDCLDVIEQAVVKHTAEGCGAFLSGGLDSSTVAGMLARHQHPANTFSIGFDIAGYDETAYAKLTAKHFATKHKVLYLQPELAVEEFVKVAQFFDEPFGNSSAMATYFCAKFAKSHGVTHLLAGDGGDEIFAGNDRYAKQKVFQYYGHMPGILQSAAKGVFCGTPLRKLPLLSKAASYITQAQVPLPDRLETYNFLNQFGVENMFNEDFLSVVDVQQPINQQKQRYFECSSDDPVDRMLYLDWKFTLADNDLVKVGRMCEMAGVDVRFPLLDKSVVDFSCTLPADIKLPGNKLRHFYKESCRGFLNDETLSKSKHGFGLPFGLWMKENKALRELALDNLLAFKKRKIVKDSLIDEVLDAHQSDHASYYGELIWIMVVLELWLQQ
jgi:asparagine synthase (glutamine-hydrolysing)